MAQSVILHGNKELEEGFISEEVVIRKLINVWGFSNFTDNNYFRVLYLRCHVTEERDEH